MASTNEIAQIDAINKGLTQLNSTLNTTAASYLTLVKTIETGNAVINETAKTEENLSKAKKKTVEATKEQDTLNKQLAASAEKLKTFDAAVYEQIQKNTKALTDQKKAINDKIKAGDAEEGSLVRMRQKLAELTAQYDKAGTRTKAMTKEINDLSKEISQAEQATNRHGREVGNYGKIWDGLKGMLPVVSIAAAGAAIVGVFNSIKNSTGATADAFQFAVKGMSTGLDFFWKTLATGNWSNFFENLNKAVTGGYAYAKMLDEIADSNRALKIIESNARGEELRLEEALKNAGLSPADRLKAGQDRINLEKNLSVSRQKIADKNFEAELNETMRQTGLSKERLEAISKDFDSEKLLMANQYNEALKFSESRRINKTAEEYAKFGAILKNTSADVKEYAATIRGYEIATDEQRDKFANSIIQRNEAINSAPENLKKVTTKVNALLAETGKETQKNNEKIVNTKKEREERAAYETIETAKMVGKEIVLIEENVEIKGLEIDKAGLVNNQNYLDEKKRQDEKAAEDAIKLEEDLKQAKIDLAVEAGNAIFEFRNMALQKELDSLQVEKDKKLSNTRLTTEQRAAIEADYEKKSNAIKAKQAKNDKLQSLFNIAVNTAQAAVKALAAGGGVPLGVPLMAATIAIGAIQAALVAARPIPKYAKGTNSAADRFIAGEAGRELMMLRSGDMALADNATYFEGSKFKGAKIFSNPETEKIIGASDRSIAGQSISDERILKGLKSVEKAILSKPVAIYDKDHRQIGLSDSQSQTIYLNRLTR